MKTPANADRIEQVSFGFTASKLLFSAIEFGLFTELAKESMDTAEIQNSADFIRAASATSSTR